MSPQKAEKERVYAEDIESLIRANRADIENGWVNVNYKGVIIPMTKEEYSNWEQPMIVTRKDKRAMALAVKKAVESKQIEYFEIPGVEGIKFLRKVTQEEILEADPDVREANTYKGRFQFIRAIIDNVKKK